MGYRFIFVRNRLVVATASLVLTSVCLSTHSLLAEQEAILNLDLDSAAALARSRAERVLAREAGLAVTDADSRAAMAFSRPSLQLGAEYTYNGDLATVPFGPFGNIETGRDNDLRGRLHAEYLLWHRGRRRITRKQNWALSDVARADVMLAARDAAFRARSAVAAVWFARARRDVATDRVQQRREELVDARDLRDVGKVTELDVRQAAINLIQAEDEVREAEAEIERARIEAAAAVASAPNTIRIVGTLKRAEAVDALLERAREFINSGPEIAALRSRIRFEEAESRIQHALMWPELRSVGEYSSDGDSLNDQEQSWHIGLTLAWRFYSGGEHRLRAMSASRRALEWRHLWEGEVRERGRLVEQIAVDLRQLDTRIGEQERAVELSAANYDDARDQYRAGLITLTRLGEISLGVAEARFRFVELVHDEVNRVIDLLRVLE